MDQKQLQIKTLSSLAKVFSDKIVGRSSKRTDAFCGNEASFQIAFKITPRKYCQLEYDIKVKSPLADYVTLSKVGCVPSMLTV